MCGVVLKEWSRMNMMCDLLHLCQTTFVKLRLFNIIKHSWILTMFRDKSTYDKYFTNIIKSSCSIHEKRWTEDILDCISYAVVYY